MFAVGIVADVEIPKLPHCRQNVIQLIMSVLGMRPMFNRIFVASHVCFKKRPPILTAKFREKTPQRAQQGYNLIADIWYLTKRNETKKRGQMFIFLTLLIK
jgi:hypothetical protein